MASAGLYASQSGTTLQVRPVAVGRTVEGVTVGGKPMTWRVVGDAIRTLADMMKEKGGTGCIFVVYSGPSLVGQGSVRV